MDLESACVRGRVYMTGAVFTGAEFRLASGRWVRPLAQAPWSGEPHFELPGHLRRLSGEFFCLPFGGGGAIREPISGWEDLARGPVNEPMHGPAANEDWAVVEYCGNAVTLALDGPLASPVERLERRIALAPDRPRVDIAVSIEMRRAARLPIAFHSILRLPENPHTLHLDADFALGLTYPGIIEPDRMICEPGKTFTSLARVPGRSGDTVNLLSFPLGPRMEDVMILAGARVPIRARFIEEAFELEIDWSRSLLPHSWPGFTIAAWTCIHGKGVFEGLASNPWPPPSTGHGSSQSVQIRSMPWVFPLLCFCLPPDRAPL